MISELDKQASLIGVTRQSIIKVWLSERIKTEKSEQGGRNKNMFISGVGY